MAANIQPMLSININYLNSIPKPVSAWGAQLPHNPRTGIFQLGQKLDREVPTATDDITHEYIHPSVKNQSTAIIEVEENITKNPSLMVSLFPLEEDFRNRWPYVPGQNPPDDLEQEKEDYEGKSLFRTLKEKIGLKEEMQDEGGRPRYEETWIGSLYHKLPFVSN